jgi:hypothetical protein
MGLLPAKIGETPMARNALHSVFIVIRYEDLMIIGFEIDENRKKKTAMKRFYLCLTILFSMLTIPDHVDAAVSVNLKLDRSQAVLTDSVQLIVSVAGSRDSGSRPAIHGLENFTVRPGGTSSRIEFITGNMSSEIDYTYFVRPQKIGIFKIGPAEVKIKGKTYTSNTVTLRVVKPTAGKGAVSRPIFLTAELSTQTVYVEEQAIYTLKLYLRRSVRGDIGLNLTETANLEFKQLAKPSEYTSTHGGKNYNVLEVRYAVVPSKSGTYSVGPAKMNMTVLEPHRGSRRRPSIDPFFKDPFSSFSRGRPVTIASPLLQLNVLPLPEDGKPPDFSGLVGSFKMWSKLDPVNIKAGESATLTVSVSGLGNIKRIPDLEIPELDHIKIYADQPVLETTQSTEGLGGSKTMKWALVPDKDGRLEVPPVAISFFDTKNRVYKTLRSSKYTLSVLPGEIEKVAVSEKNNASTSSESAVKHAVKELGRDIFPVHTAMQDFKTTNRLQLENWLLAAMFGLPFFLYLGAFCGLKIRRNSTAGQ